VLAGTTNGLNYNRSAPAHPDAIPTETYVGGTKTVVVRGRELLLTHAINAHTDGDSWICFADANVTVISSTITATILRSTTPMAATSAAWFTAYKAPGLEDGKAPSGYSPEGMATACSYQAGTKLSSRRRPTSGSDRSTTPFKKGLGKKRPTPLVTKTKAAVRLSAGGRSARSSSPWIGCVLSDQPGLSLSLGSCNFLEMSRLR
jgi:hypothetical protein